MAQDIGKFTDPQLQRAMSTGVLEEPLTLGQESIRRGTVGKAFLIVPLLIGFFFTVFLSTHSGVEDVTINMRGSPMSMSCPRTGVPTMPINAMLETMDKHGIAPHPMAKFALTSFAATRDVSMRAQAKEEFSKLDYETQTKLKKMQKDLVVRAATVNPEDLPGITKPLGFFDPAGFSRKGDRILAFRRAELKHGRICMLGTLGLLVQEKYHPFFDAWNDGPWVNSVASHFSATAASNFWPAFWIMAAGHELATSLGEYDGKDVGDYGFDPLSLKPDDPEQLLALQNKELNNGRLAMHAMAGAIVQEMLTGSSVI